MDVRVVAAPLEEVLAATATEWWREAVIYQVYTRSFADANGDGIGDLPGITARIPHLVELGVDAIWCSPFYTSPQNDAGYDVADYRDIDPVFGTLADADELVRQAHEQGVKVIIDLVPNHTSSEHAWFQAALAAGPAATRESTISISPQGQFARCISASSATLIPGSPRFLSRKERRPPQRGALAP